jgi:signal transduction histidine kinase/DNA-binding LacI/PurR family transcriptional regulator/AraC-like DNA-binding protein
VADTSRANQSPVNRLPRKRLTIGVIVDVVSGESRSSLWPGIADAVQAQGGNLLCFVGGYLRDPHNFGTRSNVIYDLIDKDCLDGLIIWASSLSSYVGYESIKSFCERFRPLPMVSIGLVLDGIPGVVVDSYQGMREALVHLIEVHGRRRLAFICGPEGHRDAEERYRSYVDVLKEYGLPFVPDLVSPHYKWIEAGGQAAMQLLLDRRQVHFDAVAAVNDNSAIGAMEDLRARGIRVPADVSVVGFNDTPRNKVVTPPLTTVPWRMYERGRQAAQLLLAMVAGEVVPDQVVLPTHLIVRQSCGCPDPAIAQAKVETHPEMRPTPLNLVDPHPSAVAGQPWTTVRVDFVATVEQAMGEDEKAPEWAERFMDAFLADLGGKSPGACLPTLEGILRQVAAAEGDVAAWQVAISTLRGQMIPFLLHDGQALIRAENIWHQARVLIGDWAQRAQARREWLAQQQADTLRRMSHALATATSISELIEVLAQELPQSGIPSCYLALYEDPHKPTEWARLVLAYDEKGRIDLGPAGQRVPAHHLATGGLLLPAKQYSMVVEPLYFQDEQLGFVLFERRPPGDMYEVLQDEISSTLKAVMLAAQNVELYQKAREAEEAALEGRRSAEEADRLKSRFLSMVSHELRTPLVLLVGLSEMMLHGRTRNRPPLPEPYRQDLARIHAGAQQLDGLVRDVLDLTRSQVGQLRLVKKPLDLGQVLKVVALVGEEMARGKGLAWQAEIPALPKVLGDPLRLQQVALNLVTNAIKFTAHGKVALKAEVRKEMVTVLVSDTGVGVPLAEQETIFDEFRQSERTAARGYGGLGVGLAICRQLVELHGGRIGVRSSGEEGGGSTFYFALPAMKGQAAGESGVSERGTAVLLLTKRAGSGRRLQEHLIREGFEVEMLCMDETADWLSQVIMAPPGAVVLDLPASERGWEVVQALKENPATQDVPVLLYALLQDSGSALALNYLTKPLGTTALAQALQRLGLLADDCQAETTILVVDDDQTILDMHTRIVQAHLPTCRIVQATDGRMALEVMRHTRPALVLLDLMMPELDGFGVLEAMQQDAALREIPVVVLTAQRLTQQDMVRLNRGVTSILEKGMFGVQETLAHIEQALAQSKALGGETQRIVRKAMAYIHEHYAEPISREEIADCAGVSVRHLTRCFGQEVGVPLTTYLKRYRIKQAKQLLRIGDKNITQVASAVGFSGSSYFTRAFRQETGVSPRAYQCGRLGPASGSAPTPET